MTANPYLAGGMVLLSIAIGLHLKYPEVSQRIRQRVGQAGVDMVRLGGNLVNIRDEALVQGRSRRRGRSRKQASSRTRRPPAPDPPQGQGRRRRRGGDRGPNVNLPPGRPGSSAGARRGSRLGGCARYFQLPEGNALLQGLVTTSPASTSARCCSWPPLTLPATLAHKRGACR